MLTIQLIYFFFLPVEMLKHSRGNYTPNQLQRCSRMGGAFGKEMQRVFQEAMCLGDTFLAKRSHTARYYNDLKTFVNEFASEALVDYVPPRSHRAFPNFVLDTGIKSPRKLGRHIRALNDDLDFWRERQQRRPRRPRNDL